MLPPLCPGSRTTTGRRAGAAGRGGRGGRVGGDAGTVRAGVGDVVGVGTGRGLVGGPLAASGVAVADVTEPGGGAATGEDGGQGRAHRSCSSQVRRWC